LGDRDRLLLLAESIADGARIDWAAVDEQADAADEAVTRQLRIVAKLAALHRTLPNGSGPEAAGARRWPSAPAIGRWAHLELLARIAGGAFGHVYRAWDPQLEREVALKLLRSNDATQIINEARRLARVRHPNVVVVHGVAEHDRRVGLWMELINGATLEQVLDKNGPFSAREAALIGIDLCRALSAIHGAGLIHRDVKAQNVMREEGGRIVLMDLGTGREIVRDAAVVSGDMAGTPLYLAPEIFAGAAASPRTDLYSAGVLLYRLVTGSFPIRAATVEGLAAAHARGARARLRDARADLPTAFVRVIDRAMAADPAERYESAGALEADLAAVADVPARPARWPRRWRYLLLLAALAVALAALPWRSVRSWLLDGRRATPDVANQISVLAVLPFENLSTNDADAYLASAVPMELTARLGQIGAAKVVPWTFMKRFDAAKTRSLDSVARITGAQAVIEGSVERVPRAAADSNRSVQVRVQIFQASMGTLLWSGSFERDIGDFFALQSDIAKAVADKIHLVLASRAQTQISPLRVVPPDAMEEYLKARYLMDVQTNVRGAIDQLQRAVAIAPRFAEAHAALASYYAMESAYFGAVSSDVALKRAIEASGRAIAIDERIADAWGARAFARFALEWNWRGAESDFQRALELDPTSTSVLIDFSNYLTDRARHDEAIDASRKAEERSPMSATAGRQVAYAYYMAHQFDAAIRQLHRVLEIEPEYVPAHTLLGRVYVLTGRTAEGIAELTFAGPDYQLMLAWAYAKSGNAAEAERLVEKARSEPADRPAVPYEVALVYGALGDNARALSWLDVAYRERDSSLTELAVDPLIDPLRSEPALQGLLTKLNLP
jgi:serine/threonine-protein kinase